MILGGSNATTPEIVAMLGNGNGSFQEPIVSTFQPNVDLYPSLSQAIAIGDVNGDGAMDLVVPDALNEVVYVLFGNNAGSFSLGNTLIGNSGGANYLADLNGDGHLDIVAMDNIGAIFYVFLGNGDGTFQPNVRYSTGAPTGTMLLTDLSGDGHPDVVASIYPGQIVFLKGNPDGTFATPVPIFNVPAYSNLVAVDDYNDDGTKDLFFLTGIGVGVCLGQGNLTYDPIVASLSGNSNIARISKGDFNNDGHSDLIMGVEGGIVILFGNGDGTFKSADFYDMGQQVGAAAVAAFNGNKIPDIAVTLPAPLPRLLIGTSQGTFSLGSDPNPSYGSQSPFTNLEVGDFNGDGNMDLTMGNQVPDAQSIGPQYVEFGSGNGSFSSPVEIPNGSPVVGDFNNDGRSDTISDTGGSLIVSLGQVDGSFLEATTTLRNSSQLFGVGDVNHDGKLDVVINYGDHLEVWFGNGDGTFSYLGSVEGISGIASDQLIVADVDGDGNADIILAPDPNPGANFGPMAIFYGNGDGTFQAPVFLPVSHRYSNVAVIDINKDNLPDLVLSDGISVAVLINLGSREFDSEVDYVAGSSISYLNVVDANGDGYPDIVVANPAGTTVTVLLNQPNGTSPEGAAVTGTFTVSPELSNSGQPIVLTLSVASSGTGQPAPTGSVTFSVNGGLVATEPLVAGTASYILQFILGPATLTITATYNGDGVYAPKSFVEVHSVQAPVYSTNITFLVSPLVFLASQTVRLSATVTSSPLPPVGIVTFLDGTSTISGVAIDVSGNAYMDTGLLSPGMHTLSAKYEGYDVVAAPAFCGCVTAIFSPSTSAPVTVTVNANATTTTLSASTKSPTAGAVVTFTANVASGAGLPFGGVTFLDGAVALGTSAMQSDGSAVFSSASLAAGVHNIIAMYNANATFAGSSSSALQISVSPAPADSSPTLVALSAQDSLSSGNFDLVASVSGQGTSPTGEVIFLDGGNILGSVALDTSRTAALSGVSITNGFHNFTASYGGDSQFAPSVSPELPEQWPSTGPGFSLGISSKVSPVTDDGSNSFLIGVVPYAGFDQVIQLSCIGNLPIGARCIFSPSSIKTGGTSYLLIQPSTKAIGIRTPTKSWFEPVPGFIALLLFLYSFSESVSHHRVGVLASLLAYLSFSILTGCGSSLSSGGASQMFVASIQASSGTGAGTIVQTAQVAVNFPDLK